MSQQADLIAIEAIRDPLERARQAHAVHEDHSSMSKRAMRIRDDAIRAARASGTRPAPIALALGISRQRVAIILGETSPEPAFWGADSGHLTVMIGQKKEAPKKAGIRGPVIAQEDVAALGQLQDAVRPYGITASLEVVPPPGMLDLSRPGLVVMCGPRLSPVIRQVLLTDPDLRFSTGPDGAWQLEDRRTGTAYPSPMDHGEPADYGYLARLPRIDGKGAFLYMAGVHAMGEAGIVHYLTGNLAAIWDKAARRRFSAIIRCEFDPGTRRVTASELATPLYFHDERNLRMRALAEAAMRADVVSEPGGASVPNEDWAAAAGGMAVVLDGVTSVTDMGSACSHGTPWFTRQLGFRLMAARYNPGVSLAGILTEAIRDVAGLHERTCDPDSVEAPSAAVGMLRVTGGFAEWLVLADVSLVLYRDDGSYEVVTDDRVDASTAGISRSGPGGPERRAALAARRELWRNRPGGYWVAGGRPEAAWNAVTGEAPLDGITGGFLMTDGAARIADLFGHKWEALRAWPAADMIRMVRVLEAEDPACERWPRWKPSDDATVVAWERGVTEGEGLG